MPADSNGGFSMTNGGPSVAGRNGGSSFINGKGNVSAFGNNIAQTNGDATLSDGTKLGRAEEVDDVRTPSASRLPNNPFTNPL